MKEIYRDQLESERLITRKLIESDKTIWADFFSDPEAVEFIPESGLTSDGDKAKHWIAKQINRYKENEFGLQVLIDKQTGSFIGQCGLLLQEVDGIKEIEVGYHMLKKYWGQGYAPEAARLFIGYAFENKLTDAVISIIDINNIKSQRVAEKNGLTREKQTRWKGMDVYIYRLNRENWKE